jgi:hypothetical protein
MSGSTWWSNFHGVTYFEDHGKHENEANELEALRHEQYGKAER